MAECGCSTTDQSVTNDPVPSCSFPVLKRNAQDVDKYANGTESFQNRTGTQLNPLPVWDELFQAALDALAFQLQPLREGPVDLSSLIDGVFSFSEIQYVPGENQVWIFANGSKIELGSDYTETGSASVTLTDTYLANAGPDTRLEAWTVDLLPNNSIKASGVSYDGDYATVQEAIEASLDAGSGLNYITLEQFDPDAGTGGNDTAAFDAACTASFIQGRPILGLNKTYRINPMSISQARQIKVGLYGLGADVTKFVSADNSLPATDYWLLGFNNSNDLEFKNFSFDCGLSADPVNWTGAYDNFTGARGLVLINCDRVSISSITTTNVMQASVAFYTCDDAIVSNVHTNRNRGQFGDAFYSAAGKNHTYINCTAYDFTRIGFVGEGESSNSAVLNKVLYQNCHATYGHHQSSSLGGTEFNAGFWSEFAVNVTHVRCSTYDTNDTGFRAPIGVYAGAYLDDSLNFQDNWAVSYYDCVAGKAVYGFVGASLNDIDTSFLYSNSVAYDVAYGFYIGDTTVTVSPAKSIKVRIENCKVSINSLISGGGVLPLGGHVTIDNLDVYFPDQPDWQALAESGSGMGSISWFGDGTQRPDSLTVKNLRTYNAISRQPIVTRISMGSNSKVVDATLEDMSSVFMDELWCNRFVSRNVTYSTLGTIAASQSIDWSGGGVSSIYNEVTSELVPVLPLYNSTFFININNVRFSLPAGVSQTLLIVNIDSLTVSPKVRVTNCRFRKDFANGSPVTLNTDSPLFNTLNVMRFIFDGNIFDNTGGGSSNPLIRSIQRETGGNAVNVQVMGKGNFRSNSTAALATSGVITTNFEALPFDAA